MSSIKPRIVRILVLHGTETNIFPSGALVCIFAHFLYESPTILIPVSKHSWRESILQSVHGGMKSLLRRGHPSYWLHKRGSFFYNYALYYTFWMNVITKLSLSCVLRARATINQQFHKYSSKRKRKYDRVRGMFHIRHDSRGRWCGISHYSSS